MEQIKTKCKCCCCWREATAFIKNDKVMKTCNGCREYRENNKCKNTEYQQKWYTDNKDKRLEQIKKYYTENRDKKLEQCKKYQSDKKIENPLKVKFQQMIRNSRTNDKKYNRPYNEEDYITYEFLMSLYEEQQGKCFYENCNCEMTLDFNKSCRTPTQISIQRLDNETAHIKSNCVLSCFFCNVIKRMENCDE